MKKKMMLLAGLLLSLAIPAVAIEVRITPTALVKEGVTAAYTASGLATTNNYKVRNDGKVFLHFKKTGVGTCTVTIVTPGTVQGIAIADVTVSVPATTGDVFVGPLSPSLFNDASSDIEYTLSDTVSLSVGVFRLN